MKLKRTIGTGKIFLYSCGGVIALAGAVWLIINGIYALCIYGEEPRGLWRNGCSYDSADFATPWLLMAAAMMIYYRYCKMCNANNVSGFGRTAALSLLSVFVSTGFAAADLLAAKLVMERLYGGIILTRFENESRYFGDIIDDYLLLLRQREEVTEIASPYTMKTMLLIFALTAVYYYCVFLGGCYIMQCFRYGRKKTLIYYAVTAAAFWIFYKLSLKLDSLLIIFLIFMLAVFYTNPAVFLCLLPSIARYDINTITDGFIKLTAFVFITVTTVAIIELRQFPSRGQKIRALNEYREKISSEREEQVNDGQT